jgi:hypothetical protein
MINIGPHDDEVLVAVFLQPASALKRDLIRFFEPFKHLRWGDRPFRQMRIERARADI